MLPPQGESLLSLAQQLGMRVFGRHAVRRQQRSSRLQALQERYYQYVRLLASDTQVSLGGGPCQGGVGGPPACPQGETPRHACRSLPRPGQLGLPAPGALALSDWLLCSRRLGGRSVLGPHRSP